MAGARNVIRSILIFVYIAVVLLVSGLAQAAQLAALDLSAFDLSYDKKIGGQPEKVLATEACLTPLL